MRRDHRRPRPSSGPPPEVKGGQWARRTVSLLACALTLAPAAACRHTPRSTPAAGGAGAPVPGAAADALPGATLAIAGQMFDGGDADAIRAYLRTVPEIKATRFDVRWNPATVAVSRDAALRSLESVSRDGSDFVFDAAEPVVATIKPGSILWIWDLALRRVESVATGPRGSVTVHTSPIPLGQAVSEARIAFTAPVSLRNSYLAYRPHLPAGSTAVKPAAWRRPAPRLPMLRLASVRLREPGGPPGASAAGAAPFTLALLREDQDTAPPQEQKHAPDKPEDENGDWGEGVPISTGFFGKIKGYEYSLDYLSRPRGVTLILEAKKEEEGSDQGQGSETAEQMQEDYQEKLKEAQEIGEELHEAEEQVWDAKKESDEDQEKLQQTDEQYQKDLAQLKADQAARRNPYHEGPTPPPRKTDQYGNPLSDKEEQDLLEKQYLQKRDLELEEIQKSHALLDEAEEAKQKAELRKQAFHALKDSKILNLYKLATENLDVRFQGRVDLNDFALDGGMYYANGVLEKAHLAFKDINGKVHVSFIGRFGQPGNGETKVPVMHLPVSYYMPIPVDGLPFVVQLAADFNLNVFLAGQHSALKFDGGFAFNGNEGVDASGSSSQAEEQMQGEEPKVEDYQGMSPGVSGAVLAVQIPRIGLGVGVLGFSSMAFVDVVSVMTMTNGAEVAGPLGLPPCKRITLAGYAHVGVQTELPSFPILSQAASDKLSPYKEIWHSDAKTITVPDIPACQIK